MATILALSSCSENSWNDRLDGFEVPPVYNEVQSITYTLNSTDYTAIANNTTNVSLAQADGESDILKAIGNNKCFPNTDLARKYLPAYLDSYAFPYFVADNGSSALINYALPVDGGSTIAFLTTGSEISVTDEFYMQAWGSDDDYVKAFAPMTPASTYIPTFLKEQFPDAEQGDYVVVSYNNMSENPQFGESGEVTISNVLKDIQIGDNIKATAVVTALCTKGAILTDEGGSIFYYQASGFNPSDYSIGTIVNATGTVSAYNKGFQLSQSDGANVTVVGQEEYTYPTPLTYTADMIDDACATTTDHQAIYVNITGTASISGNYMNILVDGATAQGSVYYATDEIKSLIENGKQYVFEGYFMAVNGSTTKYFNIIVTGVTELVNVTLSDTIKEAAVNSNLEATGVITALSSRGAIVTDNSGSILFYQASGWNPETYPIGTAVKISGNVSAYNKGLQIDQSKGGTIDVIGPTSFTYPTPQSYNGTQLDAACEITDNMLASYVSIQGKASVSGSYINILVDGATDQGSVYYVTDDLKSQITDGMSYTFTGYFMAVSGSTTKYFNIIVTAVTPLNGTKANNMLKASTRAATWSPVATEMNAVYMYDAGKWVLPPKTVVLQPSDYTDMGQTYGNLSGDLPASLLPTYLSLNFPYSAEDDVMTVIYKYYNGSSTSYTYSQFLNDGMEWTGWSEGNMASDRFSKNNGGWAWNPSVTIYLPYIRSDVTSQTFYQACVDWVYENIDVPYFGSESIKSGVGFVTDYGNNEYYSGASAYYCNVDIRPNSARNQCSDGFGDFIGYGQMTDDEVIESMRNHFDYEVVPGVLSKLYPDAVPIEGMTVTYTITFTEYTLNGAPEQTGIWEVVGPAQFEFVSNTWYTNVSE